MSTKLTIADPTIRIRPSDELCTVIASLTAEPEMPENILKIFQSFSGSGDANGKTVLQQQIPKPEFTKAELQCLRHLNDVETTRTNAELSEFCNLSMAIGDESDMGDESAVDDVETVDAKLLSKNKLKKLKERQKERARARLMLSLNDLKWLNVVLAKRRRDVDDFNVYLHDLLATSQVLLPKNEIHKRNPELEARCVRLRLEQDARVYNAMTKNVDSSRKQMPEDTIAYQSKLDFLLK